ncbi:MAG: class I SAM-dependent methyltransferase [Nanoarchaeota archaeon]|nr:class I SAM-dependent methyltransferase [Nanoarchaeota archaeon]
MKSKVKKNDVEFGNWMRQFYNKKAKNISEKGYEYARWFSTPKKRIQYKFTIKSLIYHLRDIKFKKCLEVGCGPGTWTKLLLYKYPNASFTSLDISKEMISQFKQNINEKKKVKTIVNNFLDYNFKNEKFDFIFCSRAIEYIPNKSAVIEKFNNLLENGGKGIIISSPPHPKILAMKKFIGKKANIQHIKRISVKNIGFLLKKNGFTKIKFYPILFSDFFLVPRKFFFRTLYRRRWGILSKMFASGYIVKFEKPNEKY